MSSSKSGPRPARAARPICPLLRWARPYGWLLAPLILTLLVSASAALLLGVSARDVVDHGLTTASGGSVNRQFIGMFCVIGVYALATLVREWIVQWLGERIVTDLRKDAFRHLLGLSPAFYDRSKTAEILSWIAVDVSVLQLAISATIPGALRSGVVLFGAALILLISSFKLAVVVLLTLPVLVLMSAALGRIVRSRARAAQDKLAVVHDIAQESLGGIRTVQAFVGEESASSKLDGALEKAFQMSRRRLVAQSVFTGATTLLIAGIVAGVLWIGARDVTAGRLTAGELTAFVFYAVLIANALGSLSGAWSQVQLANGASERIMELFAEQSEIDAPAEPLALPTPVRGDISFESVSFAYPTRPDSHVLREFSLDIKAGETVALVGPSGAGKSTVFNLLLRFYDPDRGVVSVDGIDIRQLDPRQLRRHIGYIGQDPVMFDGAVADNIRIGHAAATDEEVRTAARIAGASEFIERLPEGFNTRLGERGEQLSGGQRQRLAIARAVISRSRILLFDEATSSLDASTEQLVQQALERAREGRTAMVIAHRLSTVRKSDRIVVLDQGRVVAVGTHEELLVQSDIYAEFARLQFAEA